MRVFGKVLVSTAALAFIGGLTVASAQAAGIPAKPAVSSQIELAAAKKAAKPHAKPTKKKSPRPRKPIRAVAAL